MCETQKVHLLFDFMRLNNKKKNEYTEKRRSDAYILVTEIFSKEEISFCPKAPQWRECCTNIHYINVPPLRGFSASCTFHSTF